MSSPLGICSFGDGKIAGSVCPSRFLENRRLFHDAARIVYGRGSKIVIVPEMRILKVPGTKKKIGKVDYIIGKVSGNKIDDFFALEVQAVYFSGKSIRHDFDVYLKTGCLGESSKRRLDYRSSAQKRLMPQLNLKVPVFRRWGKKFFVAVDSIFFENLPKIRSVESQNNSEITWLVYPIGKIGSRCKMHDPKVVYTVWDDVATALREGKAPDPSEIIDDISVRIGDFETIDV